SRLSSPACLPSPLTPRRPMPRLHASSAPPSPRSTTSLAGSSSRPIAARGGAVAGRRRGVIGAALLALLLSGCGREEPVAKSDEDAPLPELTAATYKIQQVTWPLIVRCQGTLYADEVSLVG